MDGCMEVWMHGCIDVRMYGCMHVHVGGCGLVDCVYALCQAPRGEFELLSADVDVAVCCN